MLKLIMNDTITIILKEYWEFKKGIKYLALYMIFVLLPLILNLKHPRALLPDNLLFSLMIMIISIGISGQLSLDSIRSEVKNKTLEYLLSLNISPLSIIFGKAILPVVIGYISSILSIFIFKISNLYLYKTYESNLNVIFYIILFFITFISSCVSVIISIYIKDEKTSPVIGITSILIVIAELWYIYSKLISNIYVFLLICIITACLFLLLAAKSLKKVDLITIR